MRLEDQVASLELAKKLKELGVKQDSHFYHWNNGFEWLISTYISFHIENEDTGNVPELLSAYTVAELGELLPSQWLGELVVTAPYKTLGGLWRVDLDDEGMLCCEKTEADARAKMLIYLLENDLISTSRE